MLTPAEIIYFWSGIMRDHAEFHIINLSFREREFIQAAQYYKNSFISIQNEAAAIKAPSDVQSLVKRVLPLLATFISFKQIVLRKLLQCDIELGLTPTFINHMINEAMEFYREMCNIHTSKKMNPTAENILLHKIWLPDASGHAAAIMSDLDPAEALLIKEGEKFKKTFDNLFIKATELGQMLERACLKDGSLELLNEEAEKKISEFICYLEKIKILREKCKAMGAIKPLIPDHMIREEKYYLYNLRRAKAS